MLAYLKYLCEQGNGSLPFNFSGKLSDSALKMNEEQLIHFKKSKELVEKNELISRNIQVVSDRAREA